MQAFEPRPIEFLGLRRHAGWTLKEYAITYGPGALRREDFAGALAALLAQLPAPAPAAGRPGLGFLILHRGRGADYGVLGWWDRENELPLRVVVREGGGWRPARDGESVCVWDLQVIGFERDAWVQTLLGAGAGAGAGADGRTHSGAGAGRATAAEADWAGRVLRAP